MLVLKQYENNIKGVKCFKSTALDSAFRLASAFLSDRDDSVANGGYC